MDLTIQVENKIPQQRLEDLLVTAFEGGSNYWCAINVDATTFPEGMGINDYKYWYMSVPLEDGGNMVIGEKEDESVGNDLNLKTIKNGLEIMAKKYPYHYGNVVGDNFDAETADVFLQCCLYGDIIFG